jgi:hypothetical protein
MKLYADAPARRLRQLVGDSLLVVWVVTWVLVARAVHDATMRLARPGEELTRAGTGLAERMRDAGSVVGDTPLVGDRLEGPFQGAGAAADRMAAAGVAQVDAVDRLATWLSLAMGAIPIVVLLAVYLPLRWRFVREATAGRRFVDTAEDLDLFALRAMARQPMHRLATVSHDPVGAWRRRDHDVVRRLALLELRDVGLREPASASARAGIGDGSAGRR